MSSPRVGGERNGAVRSAEGTRHYCPITPTLVRTVKVIYLVEPPLLIDKVTLHNQYVRTIDKFFNLLS